jgi:hypothetical protein
MARPHYRTVRLEGGPGDGRSIDAAHAWAFVAVQDGELLIFDVDAGRDDAMQLLERVPHGGWTHYIEDEADPEVFRPLPSRTRTELPVEDTGLPLWYRTPPA